MALLVFCSYDVGGFPYTFAEVLNRGGVETYFVCTSRRSDTDAAVFHRGDTSAPWNLSSEFDLPFLTRGTRAARLRRVIEARGIKHCFAVGTRIGELRDVGMSYHYWSYGNDLDACRWPEFPRHPWRLRESARFLPRCAAAVPRVRRARLAIGGADAVMISPFQREAFRSIFGDKRLFWFPHVVPAAELDVVVEAKAAATAELRAEFDAPRVFFSSTRQYWSEKKLAIMDDKGNDVILRAFAEYRRREVGRASKLLLVDKGPSVPASRALACDLGVERNILFLPEVPRPRLARLYAGADLCFGQFGTPVLSFATLEPLAFGTPVISYVDPSAAPDVPTFPEAPPLFVSRSPSEIAEFMHAACGNERTLGALGRSSWEWTRRHCSERSFVDAIRRAFSCVQPAEAPLTDASQPV